MAQKPMKLSIIVPVFNGASTIASLTREVLAELEGKYDVEIVLVNDGSQNDDSADVCARLAMELDGVLFLDLARNFGEHNAVMAGLNSCTGEVAVIIDDDFQNPPSEIEKLVTAVLDGHDVAFSTYEKKKHGLFRNAGSGLNNLAATLLIGKPYGLYLSSFKAVSRFLIDEITQYKGPYPYIDGLILRVTDNFTQVLVAHHPRRSGRSGYTLRKLISLWMRSFFNFSIIPLRLATISGLSLCVIGAILTVLVIIERFQNPSPPTGWTSLMVVILLVSGVQLFALGMLGEYLGRLYMQNFGKPQYVVRASVKKSAPDE